MKISKKICVFSLIFLLAFVGNAMLFMPVRGDSWTNITLPYTITQSGNYKITSQWIGTSSDDAGAGIGLAINASNVVVNGQNYLINLTRTLGDNGVRINNGSTNVLLENMKIRNAYVGIYALSDNFTVKDSNLNLNMVGLLANCSSNFNVQNCSLGLNLISNFFAKLSSNFTVENCNLNNGTLAGAIVTNSTDFNFKGCNLNNSPAGILTRYDQNFVFENCNITNNGEIGFLAARSDNFTFSGSNLTNSTLGSIITNSNNFEVLNSNISNNSLALVTTNSTNFDIQACTLNSNGLAGTIRGSNQFGIQDSVFSNNTLSLTMTEDANFTINDCLLNNAIMGLLADYSANFTIANSNLSNNAMYNAEITNSGNFTVQNCNITTAFGGLITGDSNNTVIQGCNFSNNTIVGLLVAYDENTLVTGNLFTGNGVTDAMSAGFAAEDTNCTVTNNVFTNNTDAFLWLAFDDETNNIVNCFSNTFTYNNNTFFFDYELASDCTSQKLNFYNNYVNDIAYVDPNCLNDTYLSSYMPFNPAVLNFNTTLQPGARVYSYGTMIGGNYWAHPDGTGPSQTGTDANHDGFIDTSFDFFGNTSIGVFYDYYPYSSNYQATIQYTSGTNQTLAANQPSAPITIAAQDAFGNVTAGITLNLASNSSTGKFYSNQACTTQITALTIPVGTNIGTFYYKDTVAGTPTLLASAADTNLVSTNFTITHSSIVDHITLAPSSNSTIAGTPQKYATTAFDPYGNSWSVNAVYSVNGTAFTGASLTENQTGNYVVTASYANKTATASLTVSPAALDHFNVWIPDAATVGSSIPISVTAKDVFGNTVTGFTGTVSLTATQGSVSPATTGSFVSGYWTGYVSPSATGSITVTAIDSGNHSGTSSPIVLVPVYTSTLSTPTPAPSTSPTASPTPSPTTITASTDNGTTIDVTISGNITSAQITSAQISADQASATTILSFNVTGASGTTGFSNMTISKSEVPYGTTPIVYIDGVVAANQGYTEDSQNYYVWFTTHFSTHNVQVEFTGQTPTPTTSPTSSPVSTSTIEIIAAIVLIAILAAIGSLMLFQRRKKAKATSA